MRIPTTVTEARGLRSRFRAEAWGPNVYSFIPGAAISYQRGTKYLPWGLESQTKYPFSKMQVKIYFVDLEKTKNAASVRSMSLISPT